MSPEPRPSLQQRDARTDALLGGFFLVLGLAVLIGLLFAELAIDRILSGVAGSILVVVGGGFLWRARALGRR
jgi:hypothetical protein